MKSLEEHSVSEPQLPQDARCLALERPIVPFGAASGKLSQVSSDLHSTDFVIWGLYVFLGLGNVWVETLNGGLHPDAAARTVWHSVPLANLTLNISITHIPIYRVDGIVKFRSIKDKYIQYHDTLPYSKAGEQIRASDRRHSAQSVHTKLFSSLFIS